MEHYPDIIHDYTISTYGRVYRISDDTIIAPRTLISDNRYLNVSIRMQKGGCRTFDIHKLMLITFSSIFDYKNLVSNHKDGIKCHNWIWNLEWMTVQQNSIHAFDSGLVSLGDRRMNGKASDELIHNICRLIQDGYSPKEIQTMVKTSIQCDLRRLITNIKNGHCHTNISKYYNFGNAWRANSNTSSTTIPRGSTDQVIWK